MKDQELENRVRALEQFILDNFDLITIPFFNTDRVEYDKDLQKWFIK